MALPQKKRFTFFGSPPLSPISSPSKGITSYFSFQEKQEEKLPNADDVRKAVDNLERLVLAAEAYRDLVNKMSKASKTLSKTLKDYGNSKGMENVHVMCFQTTSQFYENHTEIQSKLSKALQKDFDSIQKFWDKYSKRVAKDEKAHNDYVGDLDKQVKKMSKEYEKKSKKDSKSSLESHNQYMTSITNLGSEIARAQKEYSEKVAKREKRTHSIISQIVCKLAEGHFAYFNESLKKCGPSITKMKEWAPFAGEDMPPPQNLDSFLDELESQSQSDRNSTTSEKKSVSIASISEKQLAAMSFLHEHKDIENIIPTKYMQMPEPKFPVITTPEPTKPIYARPNSLVLDNLNINMRKDENTNNSSPTSSITSSPISQPTPALPAYTLPFEAKSLDLISKFSIGIRDDDNLYLRDEKVVEAHHPEVIESKAESNLLNQNLSNHFKNQERTNESRTNDVKNNSDGEKIYNKKESKKKDNEEGIKLKNEKQDDEKKDTKLKNEKRDDEKKDTKLKNEERDDEKKDTKLKNEDQPEVREFEKNINSRNSASDGSDSTLNEDVKNNEKSREETKIDENNETKKESPLFEKTDENYKTIKLISETMNNMNKIIKRVEEREISNDKDSLNISDDEPLNKSVNQSSRNIPSVNNKFTPGEFPNKNKETSSNNSSPLSINMQVSRQIEYDDDYRNEYSREKTDFYVDEIRANETNRYTNRIHRDEGLFYNNPNLARGERNRHDTNLNYQRTQQHIDDDYESYDYIPSQSHGSYAARDRSPPRTYSQRPYPNNIPIPLNRGSSVREMTDRFQSQPMNEERRTIPPLTRNIQTQITGRVSEMTSRFGERRNKRDEIANPLHISNGYENLDDRYNEQIEYRNDRYVQYDDLHNGINPVRHCKCHNCQMAIEDSIHNKPFNPRTDSNFARKNYHR